MNPTGTNEGALTITPGIREPAALGDGAAFTVWDPEVVAGAVDLAELEGVQQVTSAAPGGETAAFGWRPGSSGSSR